MESRSLDDRVKAFVEYEMRSCSMDYGCITPLYVYRMWGGIIKLEDIEDAMQRAEMPFLLCANAPR